MKLEQISQAVDRWAAEDRFCGGLVVIRKNDPWQGMSEEEVEDRKEFIRCYINREFELLLPIPIELMLNDFWFTSYQEFMASAFNTWDFQRDRKPFNKYAYRIRKILEQVKELAILHSSISQPEDRANIQRRYESLVDNEFRDRLLSLVERHQRAADEEQRCLSLKNVYRSLPNHLRLSLGCRL